MTTAESQASVVMAKNEKVACPFQKFSEQPNHPEIKDQTPRTRLIWFWQLPEFSRFPD
jgi:hypothetical protein